MDLSLITRCRDKRGRGGFTLVELLVVIGIIAVLIGILLPTLARARESANRAVCASNMRQVGMAAVNFAQEHRGYMPLAGALLNDAGDKFPDSKPETLGDSGRVKYSYYKLNNDFHIHPFPAALAPYMGFRNLQNFGPSEGPKYRAELMDPGGISKYFRCPSVDQKLNLNTSWINYAAPGPRPRAPSDFGFNEGFLGFFANERLKGNTSKIRGGADMMLLADAQGRQDSTGLYWLSFGNKEGATPPVTLADCMRPGGKGGWRTSFDIKRHRGMMNILFADGHVATVQISKKRDELGEPSGELEQIYIVR